MIVLMLPGCVGMLASATVGTTVFDRYEKYQLEKRIEELEKKNNLTRRKNDGSSYATGGD